MQAAVLLLLLLGPCVKSRRHKDALCVALGVGHVPGWVTSLAGVGAMLRTGQRRRLVRAVFVHIVCLLFWPRLQNLCQQRDTSHCSTFAEGPLKASQSHTAAGAALAWPQLEQLPLQPETREQAACCAQEFQCPVRCLSLRCKASLQWPNCLQGLTPRPSTKQGNSPVTFYESCVDMFVKSFVARFNTVTCSWQEHIALLRSAQESEGHLGNPKPLEANRRMRPMCVQL